MSGEVNTSEPTLRPRGGPGGTGDERPTVVLITTAFPFGGGEPFLETEIGYLADAFRRVVVVPQQLHSTRRALPSNVEVDTSLAAKLERRRRLASGAALRAALSPDLYREAAAQGILLRPRALQRALGHLTVVAQVRRWLGEYLRRARPDLDRVVWYTYWLRAEAHALGLAKAEYPRLRVVSRAHGFDLYAERYRPPYLPFQARLLEGVELALPVSAHGRAYLLRKFPWLAERCEVSRLGVRDPGFDAVPSGGGGISIVSCSALLPVKRVDRLLAGVALLGRRRPDLAIRWDHLGGGPERAALEASARESLPSNVQWRLHGQVSNAEVMEFYRRNPVDVFANVSESEGVPVSIMEAQSCGVPVIATAVGGTPEIVDEENGVLLDADPSADRVARALERFAEPAAGEEKRKASKDAWRRRYDADQNYPAFVERLLGLVDEPARGA